MNSPFPIITKQLSKIFSNTERREVVFRTQWFIGQYCSEQEGRWYRCRCTSVPLSLYFISILWLHSTDDRKGDGFFPFSNNHRHPSKVFFSIFTTLFFTFFSTFSVRPSIPSLFHCPTGHESRRFQCQSRIKYIYALTLNFFILFGSSTNFLSLICHTNTLYFDYSTEFLLRHAMSKKSLYVEARGQRIRRTGYAIRTTQ